MARRKASIFSIGHFIITPSATEKQLFRRRVCRVCRVIAYLRMHNIVARRVVSCHHFVARPVPLSSARRRHPLSPRVESFRVRASRVCVCRRRGFFTVYDLSFVTLR